MYLATGQTRRTRARHGTTPRIVPSVTAETLVHGMYWPGYRGRPGQKVPCHGDAEQEADYLLVPGLHAQYVPRAMPIAAWPINPFAPDVNPLEYEEEQSARAGQAE
jgi:hypothetical protein